MVNFFEELPRSKWQLANPDQIRHYQPHHHGFPWTNRQTREAFDVRTFLIPLLLASTLAPAHAHDWYTGSRNPVTGHSCCGINDCVPIAPGDVSYNQGNITFRYPLDGQTYTIPLNQTLPSPDGQNHGCVWGKSLEGAPKLCLFVGGGT